MVCIVSRAAKTKLNVGPISSSDNLQPTALAIWPVQ
jgi:hypothetical protein